MHSPAPISPTPAWRWWGLAAGILSGAVDTLGLRAVGVPLEVGGHDVSIAVALFFGTSFAALGFLVGYLVEQRRRERHMAAVVQQQVETLAALRSRLAQSEKLAALGQLAATIAHEVRNPLGVIRSAAQGIGETLADTDGDTDSRQACRFIIDEIDRLNGVITSLLAFARPLTLQRRPTAVCELVDRAVLLTNNDLDRKSLRLQRAAAGEAELVLADPDLATQALVDLLTNAAEASPIGSEIALRTLAETTHVAIEVSDHGPGVPENLRQQIFEPFFTTRSQGTGLGLAVARQIAGAHGGGLRLDHSRSGGCFALSLPRAERSTVEP